MDDTLARRLYHSLYRIRRVEEEIAQVYPTDKIQSPVHLSIGQEAVAVGVCEALRREDVVFGFYRSHALYLAKGGDLKKLIAELYGKATGCAKGKGGSMHVNDIAAGVMGTSAVVATGIPQAVGYADQVKYDSRKIVVVCFFGDGAVDEGVFHESMNLASLWKVPLLFVCENNRYAIHTHQRDRQAFRSIADLARQYQMPVEVVENGDVFTIHRLASRAVSEMREAGSGPRFLECSTYRWKQHVGPDEDFSSGYRRREEAEAWFAMDQVRLLAATLKPEMREEIEGVVEREIREAFEFAEASPFPSSDELSTDLVAE